MTGTALYPRLQVLVVAVLFSTGGAVVKAASLSGWQVAGLRSLVAAVTLYLLIPGARRGWSGRVLLVGVAYAGALVGFVISNKLTTAANAVFLAGTAPLYVALLAPWLLGERRRRRDLIYMAVMVAGLALCLTDAQPRFATAPDPRLGNLVGIVTGVFWAFTILGLRWLARAGERESAAAAAVVSGNVIAFVACLPAALPLPMPGPLDLGIIVYLGTIQIGLAYAVLTAALRRVPALEASLLLLVEPVLNSLLSWAVHGEVPGTWALAGAGLILASTAIKIVADGGGPERRPP